MKKAVIALICLAVPLLMAGQALSCRCINGIPYRCDAKGNCVVDYETCGYICPDPTPEPDPEPDPTPPTPDPTPDPDPVTPVDPDGPDYISKEVDKRFLQDKYDIWVQGDELGTLPFQGEGLLVEQKTNCDVQLGILRAYLDPKWAEEKRKEAQTMNNIDEALGMVVIAPLPRRPTYFEALNAMAKLQSDCPSQAKAFSESNGQFPLILMAEEKGTFDEKDDVASIEEKGGEGLPPENPETGTGMSPGERDARLGEIDEKLEQIDRFRDEKDRAAAEVWMAESNYQANKAVLLENMKAYSQEVNEYIEKGMLKGSSSEDKYSPWWLWAAPGLGHAFADFIDKSMNRALEGVDVENAKSELLYQQKAYIQSTKELSEARQKYEPYRLREGEMNKWEAELRQERAQITEAALNGNNQGGSR